MTPMNRDVTQIGWIVFALEGYFVNMSFNETKQGAIAQYIRNTEWWSWADAKKVGYTVEPVYVVAKQEGKRE